MKILSLLALLLIPFGVLSDTKTDFIVAHNTYRCMHNVPLVSWSHCVENSAQEWANRGQFAHSKSYYFKPCAGPAGENLANGFGDPKDAITTFYNEKPYWDRSGKTAYVSSAGHYTAMMWKSISHIGCARNGRLDVCRYKSKTDKLDCTIPNMAGCFRQNMVEADPSKTKAYCTSVATQWGLGNDVLDSRGVPVQEEEGGEGGEGGGGEEEGGGEGEESSSMACKLQTTDSKVVFTCDVPEKLRLF